MTKIVLLALVLVGCTDDSLHDVVTCDPAWNASGSCERACETIPANFSGTGEEMPCDAIHADYVGERSCSRTFEFEGVHGCCLPGEDQVSVQFFECVHQP